jgi:FkbM family methyltransferase
MTRTLASAVAEAISRVLLRLPADAGYRLARRIVDRRHGDNDSHPATNGELRVMRTLLPRAAVVFDVGANVGNWTADALAINPRAEIHAFEPGRATFDRLRQRNFPANVHRNELALGAVEEERAFFVFGDTNGTNSLYRREGLTERSTESSHTVHVTTLDAYCQAAGIQRIDFLKIDVEGHEMAVLDGARTMLGEGRIDYVQIEYGGTYLQDQGGRASAGPRIPAGVGDLPVLELAAGALRPARLHPAAAAAPVRPP